MWTSAGETALRWLRLLASRLERVRVVHGSWERCLNHHYGGDDTAIFFDPPYLAYEKLYGSSTSVARDVEAWCRDNASGIRVALCGHRGDYDLPGWTVFEWSRGKHTYGGASTTELECIWFSPACLKPERRQRKLFDMVVS